MEDNAPNERPTIDDKPPTTIRRAGALVALEGGLGVIAAVVMVILGLRGDDQSIANSYGTGAWFAIIGGGVLVGGIALLKGRRWGRAIAVVAQLLLLPVAYALLTDSHQPLYGIPLIIAVIVVMVLLFMPASVRWLAHDYGDS
ncbi:hypothetical protein HH308_11945 [Gordonia sp. TBRC 11910]|uniref:Integral membrane protein n=1 Tax=Gordonia asplenii TaxID=2725283 RepID=A0A848KUH3_9ACTN|nr:hypothetical protein [Gordonia asplenii]NMO01922.1 hypothetical protein [Gordonia asplenii]